MADEKTIKIELKKELIGLDGKVKRNAQKLRTEGKYGKMSDTDFQEAIKDKSADEIRDMAPIETVGEGIRFILANCIKPATNEEAAKLFTYITKMNNVMETAKAEWTVDKDDLKKFRDLLDTSKENISIVYNGQIEGILEKYDAELTIKKDN